MSKNEDRIPVWCKSEEWCALKSTSKILGHKWVPVITFHIYDNDEIRFSELKKEIGGITNKKRNRRNYKQNPKQQLRQDARTRNNQQKCRG